VTVLRKRSKKHCRMICAARRRGAPWRPSRCAAFAQALFGFDRGQALVGVVDGQAEAAAQLVGKARAARGHGVRRPSSATGSPTTRPTGCHSRINARRSRKSARRWLRHGSSSADAPAPAATRRRRRRCAFPQNRRPATVPRGSTVQACPACSARFGQVDSEHFQRRRQSLSSRQSKRMRIAGTVSQAFCASSCSSCPAPHPE
jgi:hypothetical protein